ncbi:MAG: enolase-phosphatase E1 [Oleiphilaceae bacterium]|jgi:enolase-phosphatase E1
MISMIVTDIEGTTSSISFVHDVLFPYASAHLESFILQNMTTPDLRAQLDEAARIAGLASSNTSAISKQLLEWIADDQKITPLKAIQGMIWQLGYMNGDFKGHIYDDAYEALSAWKKSGIKLHVYSSGSVAAQKLLFGHTKFGDLNTLFSDNFDTLIGGKKETNSYLNISQQLNTPTNKILFLSDSIEELDAAKEAGMETYWLIREGDFPAQAQHRAAKSFNDIRLN